AYTAPTGENGWDYLRRTGVWEDTEQEPFFELYARELMPTELAGARLDAATKLYHKAATDGPRRVVGNHPHRKARGGFLTPTRKFTVRSDEIVAAGAKVGFADDGWPRYFPVPSHEGMAADRFHLVTFKWNVHTQGRTAPQKFLTEIVHANPLWM